MFVQVLTQELSKAIFFYALSSARCSVGRFASHPKSFVSGTNGLSFGQRAFETQIKGV